MGISVSEQPNHLGTHRYDVFVAGRATHGYRRTPGEARQAAHEDAGLIQFCGRAEREEAPEEATKPTPRRLRRDFGPRGGME